jgi:hypothetical protein
MPCTALHLICSDQPLGHVAAWARARVHAVGHAFEVVPCDRAMERVENQRIDSVLVDIDSFDAAALSLLSALWKFQSAAPVWLASRSRSHSERLLRMCSPQGFAAAASTARPAVSLCSLSALSATSLLALSHLSHSGPAA